MKRGNSTRKRLGHREQTKAGVSFNPLCFLRVLSAPMLNRGLLSLQAVLALLFMLAAHTAQAQENRASGRLERAAALISDNRTAEAEQQLNELLKGKPDDALALNLLGTIRAKQGRMDEAEALFSRAVRLDKELIGAHMNLAYLYLLKGLPDKTAFELKEV
ncbi:MAG TPA: tetratricopeptide repeat protein, partial [Pyrinomonadaceae bacterium]